jgi:hypothetical protein
MGRQLQRVWGKRMSRLGYTVRPSLRKQTEKTKPENQVESPTGEPPKAGSPSSPLPALLYPWPYKRETCKPWVHNTFLFINLTLNLLQVLERKLLYDNQFSNVMKVDTVKKTPSPSWAPATCLLSWRKRPWYQPASQRWHTKCVFTLSSLSFS